MKDHEKYEQKIRLTLLKIAQNEELTRLLDLEKERRGTAPNELVFVGTANVASYYWCATKSVLISREREPMFFGAYLHDRLLY